ncbi:MAG: ATP-binding protein [Prolixibacteraceae bacterium]|nr:ATP-binding protein [Prolixibacteraceae bacterium]
MSTPLYALLLEDVQKDAELLHELLIDEGFDIQMDVVEREPDYVSSLKSNNYDIILADFTLPGFNGQHALEYAKDICPAIPFICISGTIGEDRAVELLKQGATDYVLKDRLERLGFAVRRALEAAGHLKKFKQAEIEAKTNRKLLQTIINNALDIIYIKDINGRYLLINEATEKAFGKRSSAVTGKDDFFILPETEARQISETDRKVIHGGVPVTFEESLTFSDGQIHILHTIKCPMFDDYGNPSGLFGIARDITERKQMEENMRKAKEKAEESDRLKTAFLHNISHEIRTPMNAIVGFSELLSDPYLPVEKRSEFTNIISKSSKQLLSIISDIVSIATLEAKQEKITEDIVNLNEILITLHAQFELRAKQKNLLFGVNCGLDNENAIIRTDQTKLIQILSNLINNAIKFTQQGHVNFGYQLTAGNEVEFYVDDTGIGISPDMQEIIFQRFRQADSTISDIYGGTGLGLSISRGYVELLGGKIEVKSQPGQGSVFRFTIPYCQ